MKIEGNAALLFSDDASDTVFAINFFFSFRAISTIEDEEQCFSITLNEKKI